MFRRKKDRYEYFFITPMNSNSPRDTERSQGVQSHGKDYGSFGNMGSQGWRYIGLVNDLYAFERKVQW